jgi:hypothetical protein
MTVTYFVYLLENIYLHRNVHIVAVHQTQTQIFEMSSLISHPNPTPTHACHKDKETKHE